MADPVKVVKNSIKDRDRRKFLVMLSKTTREASIVLQSFIVPLVPVDKGLLRKSIRSDSRNRGDTFVGSVGTNVEYASAVEYRDGGSLSYLRLGLDKARPLILKLFDKRISEHLISGV